jgi:hypothetical protein
VPRHRKGALTVVVYDDSGRRIRRPLRRSACAACGRDGTGADPLVKATDGYGFHRSHTTDPRHGYYRQEQGG